MASRVVVRRFGLTAGCAALIALGGLTAACGSGGKEAPSSTTTTTTTTTTTAPATSSATVAPTEKSIDPNGGNLFTPSVLAPPAPTEPPGVHRHGS